MPSKVYSVSNLNKALLILTVIDDFFEVDVSAILARLEQRRHERLQ